VEKDASAETAREGSLPRRLGLLSAIAVLVGSTIGTGIFRTPASIATRVPDETLYLLLWVAGGFFSLCGALTLAELAAALPRTGGVFVYLREGWGRLPAFMFGWAELVIIRASALGAISTAFAEYLLRFIGEPHTISVQTAGGPVEQSAPTVHYIAAAAIVVVAVLNILGIRLGALVQNLTTGTKYAALVILVLAAFLIGGSDSTRAVTEAAPLASSISTSMVGLAFISLLWAYDGWADVTFVGGEVQRPERFLPITLIGGTIAVIAIYLLANLAYIHLLGIDQIAGSKLVAADAATRIIGDTGAKLTSLAVMISAFGTLNGSMMTGPRIFFAMADDGLFFKKIASVHPRFKTPYVAITLAATMAVAFVMVQNFEQLADTFVLGIWPFYAGAVAAVYALRKKRPDLNRPYKTLGYPVTPILFILAVTFLIGNAIYDDLNAVDYYGALLSYLFAGGAAPSGAPGALMVFAIVLTGIPAYFIWKATHKDS
jgi:amino acid transporter